jgi:hypothetical protein
MALGGAVDKEVADAVGHGTYHHDLSALLVAHLKDTILHQFLHIHFRTTELVALNPCGHRHLGTALYTEARELNYFFRLDVVFRVFGEVGDKGTVGSVVGVSRAADRTVPDEEETEATGHLYRCASR